MTIDEKPIKNYSEMNFIVCLTLNTYTHLNFEDAENELKRVVNGE